MNKKIQPQYYDKAEIVCACGQKIIVGSTKKKMNVEICAACHPLFTKKAKFIDKASRIEKFKTRLKKTKALQKKK